MKICKTDERTQITFVTHHAILSDANFQTVTIRIESLISILFFIKKLL